MIILIQCKDRVGLVAAISGLMAQKNINIVSMREFVDIEAKQFFARLVCEQNRDPEILLSDLHLVLPENAFIKRAQILIFSRCASCSGVRLFFIEDPLVRSIFFPLRI